MRAIRYDSYGDPSVLKMVEIADPRPGPGEVLVGLKAASVIPADWKVRSGMLRDMLPVTLPKIPGRDGAGIVLELGDGVDYASVGDAVCVVAQHAEDGTYAEKIVRDQDSIVAMPETLEFGEAASLMHAGICAWICLVETADMKAGARILVHAGAGAIGGLAIQLAHHLGCHVTTTCRAANADYVTAMGADDVIAYDQQDFTAIAKPFDIVLDLMGGEVHRRSYDVLKRGGHMVCLRAAPFEDQSERYDVQVSVPHIHDRKYAIEAVTKLARDGVFRPQVARRLPLAQASEAHRMMEAGKVSRGRIVLDIA